MSARVRVPFLLAALLLVPATAAGAASPARTTHAGAALPDRSVDPVVLTGAQFPSISAGPEIVVRHPEVAGRDPTGSACAGYHNRWDPDDPGDHNCYQQPDVRITAPRTGAPVGDLRGWRWDGPTGSFVQIPFQVDERFTRFISNNASGFAIYSGVDAHLDYAFDREGWRFTDSLPSDPCRATPYLDGVSDQPGPATTPDPVPGLDDNDELVFMASDAGGEAPAGAAPPGTQSFAVRVVDPADPSAVRFAYVSVAGPGDPPPPYTAANGYVRYMPDHTRDLMVTSQSSYSDYGAAPKGPVCDPAAKDDPATPVDERSTPLRDADGNLVIAQRRELDTAWVRTPRYAFRFDGRWLMTQLRVRRPDGSGYGPDLIDRWKARAFAQDPSSDTPCCGYEEEQTNWGGSSVLLGERSGPVRTIRATWGADSGTNVVREEVFYRDAIDHRIWLRVHPIPPLDGIYSQWDYNAGRVDTYYNPSNPGGVAIDGRDDELAGNLDDPCNPDYDTPYGELWRQIPESCSSYHQSVDLTDPTFSAVNETLQWEEVTGRWGTTVDRWAIQDVTPGDAQGIVAAPYYRDDSCFDDGTGADPGPRLIPRAADEPDTATEPDGSVVTRTCWSPADGLPHGDPRFYQGSIGTSGLHLLFIAEADNASLTAPLTEVSAVQRQVVLPGGVGNVGERYGQNVVVPLQTVVTPR